MSLKNIPYLVVLLFLLAAPAWAALPPLDDAERQNESSEVFRGRIVAIYSRKRILDKERSDTEMVLEIEVESSVKGVFTPGMRVFVKCWEADQRPEGWVGDGGQRPWPREGATGLFFAKESGKGVYHLLHPNGWDPD